MVLWPLTLIAVLIVVFIASAITAVFYNRTPGRGAQQSGVPSCGACGYATRGITELKCPECGADLTKVGIIKAGERRPGLAGCLLPLLLTIMTFLVAVLGYNLAGLVVPTYRQQSMQFDLVSASDEYSEVLFETDLTTITPPGQSAHTPGISISSTFSTPPVTSITIGGAGSKIDVDRIAMQVMPTPKSSPVTPVTYTKPFEVDPATRLTRWTDAQGNRQASQGPFTDQDVLAFLGSAGADTNRPEVVLEAQQLQAMIDGLLSGTNQFTLQGFDNGGYGAGGSRQLGPIWFLPAYIGAWVLIWIIGLVVLARRARKH